tara:strand:+ start:2839 stop:3321 length:483 start_codon:yes stop_codon:yes gene_type:complete
MISYLLSDAKFWTAVAFVIFIVLIFKPVKSILIKSLDQKIKIIKNNINNAENIENDAKKLLSDVKINEKNLNEKIDEFNKSTKTKIENLEKEMSSKLEQQINRKKELNELKIKQLEQEASEEIKNKTSYLAIKIVKNYLENKLDEKSKDKIFQDSLKNFN